MTGVVDIGPSPNFLAEVIPVEFVILHYTATDLVRTLAIFDDENRGVAAHFVINDDGVIYDLGHFFDGDIRRGAHAGESRIEFDGHPLTTLNACSIGIELVQLNGNLFDYPDVQYDALVRLLRHLLGRFPRLFEPGRIVGHEHVAGFRGKCDPGRRFDWARVLGRAGVPTAAVHRRHALNEDDLTFLTHAAEGHPPDPPAFWEDLSSRLEARVRTRQRKDE